LSEDRVEELDLEVAERRSEVERRLARLRAAIASEVGVAPRRLGWLLLILAGGAGVALALRRRVRRAEKDEGRRRKKTKGRRKARRG
jgi:hypothetical protein